MTSLEFAIALEEEGEKYYLRQAELNQDNYLAVVFNLLAKDEKRHAEILRRQFVDQEKVLEVNSALKDEDNIFVGIKDFVVKLTDDSEKQLKVYDEALNKEKESIELYQKLHDEAKDDTERALFAYLISQEKEHYHIFYNMLIMLNRPNEWVESAEFGLREEY